MSKTKEIIGRRINVSRVKGDYLRKTDLTNSGLANTVFIIPAFNEVLSIGNVIDQLCIYGPIIVINDGSTDGTLELCERYEVTVISHDGNPGYGMQSKLV